MIGLAFGRGLVLICASGCMVAGFQMYETFEAEAPKPGAVLTSWSHLSPVFILGLVAVPFAELQSPMNILLDKKYLANAAADFGLSRSGPPYIIPIC